MEDDAAVIDVVAGEQPISISGEPESTKARTTPSGFLCGDCGAENTIKAKDAIRCRECGYRILYKKRERKCRQFLAR